MKIRQFVLLTIFLFLVNIQSQMNPQQEKQVTNKKGKQQSDSQNRTQNLMAKSGQHKKKKSTQQQKQRQRQRQRQKQKQRQRQRQRQQQKQRQRKRRQQMVKLNQRIRTLSDQLKFFKTKLAQLSSQLQSKQSKTLEQLSILFKINKIFEQNQRRQKLQQRQKLKQDHDFEHPQGNQEDSFEQENQRLQNPSSTTTLLGAFSQKGRSKKTSTDYTEPDGKHPHKQDNFSTQDRERGDFPRNPFGKGSFKKLFKTKDTNQQGARSKTTHSVSSFFGKKKKPLPTPDPFNISKLFEQNNKPHEGQLLPGVTTQPQILTIKRRDSLQSSNRQGSGSRTRPLSLIDPATRGPHTDPFSQSYSLRRGQKLRLGSLPPGDPTRSGLDTNLLKRTQSLGRGGRTGDSYSLRKSEKSAARPAIPKRSSSLRMSRGKFSQLGSLKEKEHNPQDQKSNDQNSSSASSKHTGQSSRSHNNQ